MAGKMISSLGLLMMALVAAHSAAAAPSNSPAVPTPTAGAANGASPVVEPVIDWGKCPQLAPSEEQRKQKTDIIRSCLEKHPLNVAPEQLNAELVDKHRIQLGECALTKEDWFNADKSYKYDKAEEELRKKDVEAGLKTKILDQHKECKTQALTKFPNTGNVIEQVQFYQSCMDYYVSQICSVKIMLPAQQ